MQVPVIAAQQAGLAAASADMNAYSQAAGFLMAPPCVSAGAVQSAQTLTGGVATAITWAQPSRDNDAAWASGAPTVFTVGTQGWYEAQAHILVTNAAGSVLALFLITNGPSNPNGAGTALRLAATGTASPTGVIGVALAGLLTQVLYPGDTIAVQVTATTTAATGSASLNGVTMWPTYSHQWVST